MLTPKFAYADTIRENAKFLADSIGGLARFSEKVGISDSHVSQIIGKNPTRNIGSKMARRIEAAFEKPIGSIDRQRHGIDFGEASAELAALKETTAKASACLGAPDIDRENLVKLALTLLEAISVHT
jgi:hypothetical protein